MILNDMLDKILVCSLVIIQYAKASVFLAINQYDGNVLFLSLDNSIRTSALIEKPLIIYNEAIDNIVINESEYTRCSCIIYTRIICIQKTVEYNNLAILRKKCIIKILDEFRF